MGGSGKRKRSRLKRFARRTPPGAMPGTIITDPDMPRPRLRAILYGPEAYEEVELTSPEEAAALIGQQRVLWLNVDGLGDAAVITRIGEIFRIHKLALEDVVNVHQRAKVETYDDHLFIVIREPELDGRVETDQISMFLGANFIVTFQEHHGDCFDPVRDRIRRNKGKTRSAGPDYLAYSLIDAAIDSYFPVLERFGEVMEQLEDETIDEATRGTVARIHEIKRELLVLRRAIWPAREAISALIRDELPHITPECKVYLRDCYDHLVQLIDMVETYRETGGDLMEVYLSSVSNRLNEVMKVLTIISTIFIPLSFIAGVYGMNFNTGHPANMPELNWKYGYMFALGLMAATAAAMLVYFFRKGWLGHDRRAHHSLKESDQPERGE